MRIKTKQLVGRSARGHWTLKTFETQHRPFHVTATKFTESEGDRQKERKEKTNIATFANVKVPHVLPAFFNKIGFFVG